MIRAAAITDDTLMLPLFFMLDADAAIRLRRHFDYATIRCIFADISLITPIFHAFAVAATMLLFDAIICYSGI